MGVETEFTTYQIDREMKLCPCCNKLFSRAATKPLRVFKKQKFCGNSCRLKVHEWKFKKGQIPWNKNSQLRKCIQCLKEEYVAPSVAQRPYCSRSCLGLWRRKHWVGKKNKNWKGGISTSPEYNKLKHARRRTRKIRSGGSFTIAEWELLKQRYDYTCPACNQREPTIKLTVDHICPLSKGGSNYIINIQPLCMACNQKKYCQTIKYDKS